MKRITIDEFQRAFDAICDAALKETIIITKEGCDHLVLLATDEYQRLKRRERKVYAVGELPDKWLQAIQNSHMDSRHDHLNGLLKE